MIHRRAFGTMQRVMQMQGIILTVVASVLLPHVSPGVHGFATGTWVMSMVISYVLRSSCPSPKLGLGKLPPKDVHLWRNGLPSGLGKGSAPCSVDLRSQGQVTIVMDAGKAQLLHTRLRSAPFLILMTV